MRKNSTFVTGILSLALVFGFVLTGCENPTDGGGGGVTVEYMSGTVAFDNIPSPAPYRIDIVADYASGGEDSRIGSSTVTLDGTTGTWSIPVDGTFLAKLERGSQTVTFQVNVKLTEAGSSLYIQVPNIEVSKENRGNVVLRADDPISLQTVNLSGTIDVNDGGQPVPTVVIQARKDGRTIAETVLTAPGANAAWSMSIAVQQGGKISFRVRCFDSSGKNRLFERTFEPDATANVSTTAISDIALDVGDISVGRMSGTVTFTNIPSPAPYDISVSGSYTAGGQPGSTGSGSVTLSGSNGTWSIPRNDTFLAALDNGDIEVTFALDMRLTEGSDSVTIGEVTRTVSKNALGSISLGTVDLALIELSGTVNVNNDGSPVPRVNIQAYAGTTDLAELSLTSPAANAPWSMRIPAQQGVKVTFKVYYHGSESGGSLVFDKTFEPSATANVNNQSISGIAFDVGDISVGRLSGTVTFTNIPSPAPYRIYVTASYMNNNQEPLIIGGWGYIVNLSGSNGIWSIPPDDTFLAALESGDIEVTFALDMRLNEDSDGVTRGTVTRTVSKNDLGSINLGTVDLTVVTLSGTVNVSNDGSPVPQVYIQAYAGDSYLPELSLTSPAANTSWSMRIHAQQGMKVTFRVYGYDSQSGGSLVFSKIFEPSATANVSNQFISGIALDVGDVSVGRFSGTVAFTNMPSPALDLISVSASYIHNNQWQSISDGWGYTVNLNGSNGTWSIPPDDTFLAALESGNIEVTFYLNMFLPQEGGDNFRMGEVKKMLGSIDDLAGIDLGTVDLTLVTLSGTATVTYNGQPAPHVEISAFEQDGGWLGSTILTSPAAGAPWSIKIASFKTATNIRFDVRGIDSNWSYDLFSQDNVATASNVTNSDVSGISITLDALPQ